MVQKMKNKIALVTGGSRGIGRGIVLALQEKGCIVICNYNRTKPDYNKEITLIKADVSSSDSVISMFDKIKTRFGSVDFLINNAGISRSNYCVKISDNEFDSVLKTNFYGAFYCSREAIKIMNPGGRIINISSVHGLSPSIGTAHYAASKSALISLTKTLALECAPNSITVNSIAPGLIETDMIKSIKETVREKYISRIPLGRVGDISSIAHAVKFLIESDYITGQTIVVDGGLSIG
jgi:3-oxoacyl-[acyl-carrier protein] reductase